MLRNMLLSFEYMRGDMRIMVVIVSFFTCSQYLQLFS